MYDWVHHPYLPNLHAFACIFDVMSSSLLVSINVDGKYLSKYLPRYPDLSGLLGGAVCSSKCIANVVNLPLSCH